MYCTYMCLVSATGDFSACISIFLVFLFILFFSLSLLARHIFPCINIFAFAVTSEATEWIFMLKSNESSCICDKFTYVRNSKVAVNVLDLTHFMFSSAFFPCHFCPCCFFPFVLHSSYQKLFTRKIEHNNNQRSQTQKIQSHMEWNAMAK